MAQKEKQSKWHISVAMKNTEGKREKDAWAEKLVEAWGMNWGNV